MKNYQLAWCLILLHSECPKLYGVLAVLSAIGLFTLSHHGFHLDNTTEANEHLTLICFKFFCKTVSISIYSLLMICRCSCVVKFQYKATLKCLNIGTPKTINFPFVPNGKLMILGVPIFKHIIIWL